jgi:hypothetical protein
VLPGGYFEPEGLKDLALDGIGVAHPDGALLVGQDDLMQLDALDDLQHTLRRVRALGVLELHAQDAVQHERQDTDQRMRLDPLGQLVEDRRDLDVGLQHLEATLDVGQALVALHHLGGREVGHVGHEQQLAVMQPGTVQRTLVGVEGEGITREVHLDDRVEVGLADLAQHPRLGARIAEPAATEDFYVLLAVELASAGLGAGNDLIDARLAQPRLLGRSLRVMRPDQAQALPRGLAGDLLRGILALRSQRLEQLVEFGVTPPRNSQHEFQRLATPDLERLQLLQVVQAEQAPVGHKHHALDGELREHFLDDGLQGGGLTRAALPYAVRDGQAFGGLHHAEHELPDNAPVLGLAEGAHVTGQLGVAFHAHGGEVVEDNRQLLVDERAQQRGQTLQHRFGPISQRVHGAQQPLVGDTGGSYSRKTRPFEAAHDAELGGRIVQAVEDHHAEQPLAAEGRSAGTQHAAEGLPKAQPMPQRREQPRVAHAQGGVEANGRQVDALGNRGAADAHEAANERIGAAGAHMLEAAEGGNDALARCTPVITEGFYDLHVGAAVSACDANEHGASYRSATRASEGVNENIVSLQNFRRNDAKPVIHRPQGALWAA